MKLSFFMLATNTFTCFNFSPDKLVKVICVDLDMIMIRPEMLLEI